ncbi:hypothetical protein A3L09_00430 [Thermococcus profundus]|uniref:Uncharacterized protein n=1 Tax=Thermococcus profundus TaxID=49899 RepID=A0A2Z2MB58_THEPR|nr:hypothetical protein [Thermococcus profundus]ASJ01832.1 hypothetical protein A3L09_00430 [Thermococcus profundus]
MKWLGSRLREDSGVILLIILTPSIVYLLMWNKITSYSPSGLASFEKIVPCNLSQDLLSRFSSDSALLFSKLSEVQLKAFSETLQWGLLAVFFLTGTFAVYTFGRALSSGDIVNVVVLAGSRGRALIEYSKVLIVYSAYLSVVLAPLLKFMFSTYTVDPGTRGVAALVVVLFSAALWGVAVAMFALSLLRDHASAILALVGVVLLSMTEKNVGQLFMPYNNVFFWIFLDFKTRLSPYALSGTILLPLLLIGAYVVFERRDLG